MIHPPSPWRLIESLRPLASAWGFSMPRTLCSSLAGSSGSGDSSSRPASILEKSITSLSSWASIWPQAWASPSSDWPSPDSGSFSSRCNTPITPFRGVRISWLILARKRDLASAAASAAIWASVSASSWRLRASMSRITPTSFSNWPSAP